jgi:UDP-N-acetylmuramate dehydrogenase
VDEVFESLAELPLLPFYGFPPREATVSIVYSFPVELLENIPLAPLTTLGIGGPARWLAKVYTEAGLLQALDFARERKLPIFVLGGGSNLLVSDSGFNGMVICIKMRGIVLKKQGNSFIFSAAAGEPWDDFVGFAVENNSAGIECLAGIPGTIGGTPVQNVGAYGQEVSETIIRVRAFDMQSHEFMELFRDDCGFAYRRSIFNTTERNRYIVMRVDYLLQQNGEPRVEYKDLKEHFRGSISKPTLQSVYKAVREIRHRKGMLLVQGEEDCRSAGSFFKNPVVPVAQIEAIARTLNISNDKIPHFAAVSGKVKLSAAWLLEQAGFQKGFRLGRVGISSRHTLALINTGGATAAEMLALRDKIVAEVERKFSITLEQEPMLLGF